MAHHPGRALRWITGLFKELEIEYQVVGGLAARCYGSRRPLVDIDFYVPDEESLEEIASAASSRLIRPPAPHRDEHWDLTFLALEWGEWKIEIAAADTASVWDRGAHRWTPAAIPFEESQIVEAYGVELSVMPKDHLVRYKKGLGREVDHRDLEMLLDQRKPEGPTDSA